MNYEGHRRSVGGDCRCVFQVEGETRGNLTKYGTTKGNDGPLIDRCTILVDRCFDQR